MVNLTTSAPNPRSRHAPAATRPGRFRGHKSQTRPGCLLPGQELGSRHDSAQSCQEFASSVALFFYTLCDSAVLVPNGSV